MVESPLTCKEGESVQVCHIQSASSLMLIPSVSIVKKFIVVISYFVSVPLRLLCKFYVKHNYISHNIFSKNYMTFKNVK